MRAADPEARATAMRAVGTGAKNERGPLLAETQVSVFDLSARSRPVP
jgi:hypothetical protein